MTAASPSPPPGPGATRRWKVVLFANTEWYLYNFRLSLAKRLRDDGHDLLLISPPGPYGQRLLDLGFRWMPVAMERRSLEPLAEARLLASLVRLFRQERPDLVHGLTIKCAVYGSIAARLAGVPARVNAVNGLGYVFTSPDVRARILRPIVRSLMSYSFGGPGARLVVQNPDDRAMFVAAGLIPAERIRLIPGSGVDTQRFAAANRRRGPGDTLRVVLPARLLIDKGAREYVAAAELLAGRNIEMMIAGDADPGNPSAVSPELAEVWRREGHVQLLGHVEDMAALLASVDIVALPSYREGLPKSLIEAAASGAALVATDVPGCREVVRHEENGLLVPVRDAAALAAAIARLADDPALRARLGAAARVSAEAEYDERRIVQLTLEVYREVIENG